VREGYVTEFIDGRLFAPPPMVEARKKEVEAEEHDPENFPEAPASAPPFEAKATEQTVEREAAAPAEVASEAPSSAEMPASPPSPAAVEPTAAPGAEAPPAPPPAAAG